MLTILLGLVFLGIKFTEYMHKFHENLWFPESISHIPGQNPRQAALFFSFYFAMTGMHALHMIIGIAIFAWLVIAARRGHYTSHLLYAGGDRRSVLALRRYHLDFFVSAVLSARTPPMIAIKTYFVVFGALLALTLAHHRRSFRRSWRPVEHHRRAHHRNRQSAAGGALLHAPAPQPAAHVAVCRRWSALARPANDFCLGRLSDARMVRGSIDLCKQAELVRHTLCSELVRFSS